MTRRSCCSLVAAACSPAHILHAQTRPGKVVLLSIDGLRPDRVLEADRHALKIPNLRRVLKDGVFARGVTGVLPTVTYPSHTTLLTGVTPARHGIYSNTTFDPLNKNSNGWYWYAEDIRTTTLWEAVTRSGSDVISVHWPVSVGAPVRWNLVQYWRTGTPDDRKLMRALSTLDLVDEVERALGPYADGTDESLDGDRKRSTVAAWLLKNKNWRLATVYLTALDHAAHESGPFSKEASETLEGIDELVGQLRKAAGPDSAFCIVSDHGFLPIRKEVHLNVRLVKEGLIKLKSDGKVADWQASGWVSGGTAAVMAQSPEAETRARAALAQMEGVGRIVEGQALKSMGGYPEASFVLDAAKGYSFGGDVTGQLIRDSRSKGMHGYTPDTPAMTSSFFLAGAGIPQDGDLDRVDMRDIAPTLAGLLGVELPQADGRNLLTKPR